MPRKRKAFDAKVRDSYLYDPDDLVIIVDPMDVLYDPRAIEPLSEPFVRDIMKRGVLQPPGITKRPSMPGIGIVTWGRRRVLGAREANRRIVESGGEPWLVQCVYRPGKEEDLLDGMVAENEHRKDTSPLQKAENASRLISKGKSIVEVSDTFGVHANTVRYWMSLLELPKETRDQIEAGELTITKALSEAKGSPAPTKAPRIRKKKEIQEWLKTAQEALQQPGLFENDTHRAIQEARVVTLEQVLGLRDELPGVKK